MAKKSDDGDDLSDYGLAGVDPRKVQQQEVPVIKDDDGERVAADVHDDILGLIGASGALGESPAFQAALAARLSKRSPIAKTKSRRWPLGFGPQTVAPGQTISIQVQPRVLFRGNKIINTGDSTDLVLVGLFVGQRPQLSHFKHPIPVANFAATSLDSGTVMGTCDPALAITVQVKSIGLVERVFSMTIIGQVIP